jgi:hypothetical protein
VLLLFKAQTTAIALSMVMLVAIAIKSLDQ